MLPCPKQRGTRPDPFTPQPFVDAKPFQLIYIMCVLVGTVVSSNYRCVLVGMVVI